MSTTYHTYVDTPIGRLLLAGTDAGLTEIRLPTPGGELAPNPGWEAVRAPFVEAVRELEAYFRGDLRRFALRLAPVGTAFQQRVWHALQEIPYGETVSYSDLAAHIGHPRAVRAVGHANGRNPLPIVIPCHRVIGRDGHLTGYGGGLGVKAALLALERRAVHFA